jgi:hypothetical protein
VSLAAVRKVRRVERCRGGMQEFLPAGGARSDPSALGSGARAAQGVIPGQRTPVEAVIDVEVDGHLEDLASEVVEGAGMTLCGCVATCAVFGGGVCAGNGAPCDVTRTGDTTCRGVGAPAVPGSIRVCRGRARR